MFTKLMFTVLLITLSFCITNVIYANTNLLGDFSLNASSKTNKWSVRHKYTIEKGYKDAKAICLTIEKNKKGKSYGNVLTYIKSEITAGTYEYSAYIKLGKAISVFQVVVYFKDKTGKMVYKSVRLKKADYPKLGQWLHFVAKIKLPSVNRPVNFAFEARDKLSATKIWISSPTLILANY